MIKSPQRSQIYSNASSLLCPSWGSQHKHSNTCFKFNGFWLERCLKCMSFGIHMSYSTNTVYDLYNTAVALTQNTREHNSVMYGSLGTKIMSHTSLYVKLQSSHIYIRKVVECSTWLSHYTYICLWASQPPTDKWSTKFKGTELCNIWLPGNKKYVLHIFCVCRLHNVLYEVSI